MMWFEFGFSTLLGAIGSYLLYRGKKISDPKLMIWGAILIILSYFLFSGGSKDDDASKAAMKMFGTPPSTDQTQ